MEAIKQTIEKLKSQSSETTPSDPIKHDYYAYIKKAMLRNWTADPFKKTDKLNIDEKLNQVLIDLGKYLGGEMSHSEDSYYVPHGSNWPIIAAVSMTVTVAGEAR